MDIDLDDESPPVLVESVASTAADDISDKEISRHLDELSIIKVPLTIVTGKVLDDEDETEVVVIRSMNGLANLRS